MTPQEHANRAEEFLSLAEVSTNDDTRSGLVQVASLHAMLGILGTLLPPPPTS